MKRFHAFIPLAALIACAVPARAIDFITLDFDAGMSDIQRQTFTDAAAYWNSAITGFKAPYIYETDGATVTTVPPTLTITASIPSIDGVGGVLGQAGPVGQVFADFTYGDNDNVTPNPTYARYYTKTGVMSFDSADVAAMIANNTFFGVVLHEMAHVLGIGTLWAMNTQYGVGNPMYDPSAASNTGMLGEPVGAYTGQYALAKWISEFGQTGATYVPVEKGGGSGTADGHWNEADGGSIAVGPVSNLTGLDVSDELMTGWASDQFFVSEMTLGSLEDLGYDVDYSKAGIVDHVVVVPEPAAWLPAGFAGLVFAMAAKRRKNGSGASKFR